MEENTGQKFDRVAGIYNTPIFQLYYLWAHRACFRFIKKYICDNFKILDVACGTGIFLKKLSKKNGALRLFGTDNSLKMINTAKKNCGAINFLQADAEKIPYENSSFDLITIIDAFYYFQDKEKVFEECSRVLKKNRHLFIFYPAFDLLPSYFLEKTKVYSKRYFFNLEENSYFLKRKEMAALAAKFNLEPIIIKTGKMHSFLLFQKK